MQQPLTGIMTFIPPQCVSCGEEWRNYSFKIWRLFRLDAWNYAQ